jgi:type IV pilus biogenesis protein CpaD/CtpE
MLACSIAAAALLAGGCLTSRVDAEWGEAVQDDMAAQVADPDGSGSPEGPTGLNAVTAGEVAERYYRDQARQPTRAPAPVLEK